MRQVPSFFVCRSRLCVDVCNSDLCASVFACAVCLTRPPLQLIPSADTDHNEFPGSMPVALSRRHFPRLQAANYFVSEKVRRSGLLPSVPLCLSVCVCLCLAVSIGYCECGSSFLSVS